jgi:hypothetical protein
MNNRMFLTMSALILLVLSGCSGGIKESDWTAVEKNDLVVWADDGSEVAIVVSHHEERNHEGKVEKRNLKHQIFAQNLDGSHRRSISEERDYRVHSLYFMKSAGYLIVEVVLETGLRRFDRMALNGTSVPIFEEMQADAYRPCESGESDKESEQNTLAQVEHSVIPSPNGSQLAHIYSLECGKVIVQFEHALTSDYIDRQIVEVTQSVMPMWYPEGYVILASNDGATAWKVAVQEVSQLTVYPHCTSPRTASSDVSLQGQKVYFEGDNNEKVVTEIVGIEKAFGCQ